MKSRFAILVTIAVATLAPAIASAQLKPRIAEQLNFSAEADTVQRPIDLPTGVMEILRRDRYVLDTLEDEGPSPDKLPASWFWSSQVHLAGPNEKDLVIVGRCPV